MNNQENYHRLELIEKYCSDNLSSLEKLEFEELYKADSTLADEVEEYKQIVDLLRMNAVERTIINTLSKLEEEDKVKYTTHKSWIKLIVPYMGSLAAACVIIILYASLATIQLPGSENDLTIVRNIDETVLNPIEKKVFDNFYYGQSHLADGQFQKAVENFQEVLQNTNNIRPYFKEATQWHLILAYLKNHQVIEAKALYEQMNNCDDCVYPIGTTNKIKLWWQIFWANLLK